MKPVKIFSTFVLLFTFAHAQRSQAEALQLLSPKPGSIIPRGVQFWCKWNQQKSIGRAHLSLVRKTTDQVVSTASSIISAGSCTLRAPAELEVDNDYYIVLETKDQKIESGPFWVQEKLAEKKKYLFRLPLKFKPSSLIHKRDLKQVDTDRLAHSGYASMIVNDKREDQSAIGGYYDDGKLELAVTTADTVHTWVANMTRNFFSDLGFKESDSSDLSLTIDLLKFFVKEQDRYAGEISAILTIAISGKSIWKGIVKGQAGNWGSTYSEEVYAQCYSDTYLQFALTIAENVSLVLSDLPK